MRGGAIGDFIVTLPALTALRIRWPDAHIEVIGYPHIARLARAGHLVDAVRSLSDPALARYFAPDAPIREEDEAYFASFDFIIQYLHDTHGALRDNLKRCGVKILIEASPLVCDRHATEHFLKPLESLAIYDADPVPRLVLQDDQIDSPDDRIQLAIHPGSGGRDKNWPLAGFLSLAHRARAERGIAPVFLTGDAERAYIPGLDEALQGFNRLHNLELTMLARRLKHTGVYAGNDSGISHLAAAVGTPSLVVFGSSDPSRWAPRGPHARIIQSPAGDLQALAADTAWDALVKLIDAPC